MKRNDTYGALAMAAILFLSACKVVQPYGQPPVKTDSLYRDAITTDSSTIADRQPSQLFSDPKLLQLLNEGIRNNYDLKIAVARMKAAEATLRQSRAAFLPSISAGPQVTQQKLSETQGGKFFTNDRIYQLAASASWEVDVWGKLRSARRGAVALVLQSDAYRRAVQTGLVADIAINYYTLVAYDKQLQITLQTVENRKQDVETNKALKEAGRLTEAAVAQSEATRYAAEVTIPDLQNNIRQMENALSLLTGRPSARILRDSIEVQQVDTSLQTGVPALVLSNRPDVAQAEYGVQYYFEQTNVARTFFYPTLTITAGGGWQAGSLSDVFNSAALFRNIVGGITQPIFNKGLNRQRLEVAKAQYEEAVALFQKTVLTAGKEVSDALYSYRSASDKAATRVLQLDALKKALDYNRELLKYGYATYTDVLTSEQGYLAAQLNSVSDRLQQLTSVVSLYRSLGGGWK